MTKLSEYAVDSKAFAGAAERREEILSTLSNVLLQVVRGQASEDESATAQIALYQSASAAALRGRADKGLTDLATVVARLPTSNIVAVAKATCEQFKAERPAQQVVKLAAKLAALGRHAAALEREGFAVERVKTLEEMDSALEALTQAETA